MTAATTRLSAMLLLGLLAVTSAAGQESAGNAPVKADQVKGDQASADQVARWIAELDSDSFDSRENASERLVKAGLPAVSPLKEALTASTSLEVTTRAFHILRELGLSTDLDTQDAARTALEELSRDPTSVGRRAESAIAWLNEQRASQTIEALQKLGAIVSTTQYAREFGEVEEVDGIQIDDAWQGTVKDYRRLKWLQDVDQLVLVGGKIDDKILPYVAAMPGLRGLHLYRTKISDRGLAAIGSMTSLSDLGIYYSPISDEAVETLKRLKGIRGLRLYGTKISPEANQELTAALELEKIDYRRGAFLGVSCQTLGQQCELANVLEDSPAEKAGLRAGDIIVTFAGKQVADFEGLTAVISQYGVDDVVEVEYLRRTVDDEGQDSGEQSLKTKVTLGEWAVDQVQRQPRP